jgi:hypothetical protein
MGMDTEPNQKTASSAVIAELAAGVESVAD